MAAFPGGNAQQYVYRATGTRPIRTEKVGLGPIYETKTLYLGPVEIRGYGSGAEEVLRHPHPDMRRTTRVFSQLKGRGGFDRCRAYQRAG